MTDLAVLPAAAGPTDGEGDAHESLRLWLKLLACTNLIESDLRARMRSGFDSTLPRFDMMSQLWRHPDGLKMGELSRLLMVTGGNITGITDQLAKEGLVTREPLASDRRAFLVRLTADGRRQFRHMAAQHEAWIAEILSRLTETDRRKLHRLMGVLKDALQATTPGDISRAGNQNDDEDRAGD